ncbi:MAG: ABC-F type ribosomal protection protein [Clostridia bacterium]|nr:ABC-F type ribosomal protection protein [Clostridia bacterium]
MLINVSKLKKSFGEDVLFSDVSFSIDDKDKIGFIGINGAGKSTLLKILMGSGEYDSGEIFRNKMLKIGYLEQYACSSSEKTVFDEVKTVFSEVEEVEHELEMIRWELENSPQQLETLVDRQQKLQERFSELNGYHYKNIIRSCLMGLGFSQDELEKRVNDLSGGQKTRVSLAKILLSDSNMMFLDEPTNHLDIASVEWLEEFLKSYKGAFVVISHDRYFLDRVTTKTISLENGRLYAGGGNYSAFMKQREIEKLTEQRNFENTQKEIERLEGIIEQQRRWNREKNIKTAESKQKVIDRLAETLVKPQETLKELEFAFRALPGGGSETLRCKSICKSYNESVIRNADFDIQKGERVFLLGENGCGKTTLLKLICGKEIPDSGEIVIGANTEIGYYDQIQESLDTDKTIIDEIWDTYPKMTETQIRNALAAFLFKGEDVYREINKLSGGERARVQLVKLILRPVNFLILDEPTNHLDIESREALERALMGYDGTILAVSHDRYFINKLAERIVNFENKTLVSYNGGYDYFLEKFTDVKTEKKEEKPKNLDYNEQKRLASEKRKKETRLRKTEETISQTEAEIEELNVQLMQSGADYGKASELSKELDAKNAELEELYAIWEELQ